MYGWMDGWTDTWITVGIFEIWNFPKFEWKWNPILQSSVPWLELPVKTANLIQKKPEFSMSGQIKHLPPELNWFHSLKQISKLIKKGKQIVLKQRKSALQPCDKGFWNDSTLKHSNSRAIFKMIIAFIIITQAVSYLFWLEIELISSNRKKKGLLVDLLSLAKIKRIRLSNWHSNISGVTRTYCTVQIDRQTEGFYLV